MSDGFFYIRFVFTPNVEAKIFTRRFRAVVEVPKDLVQREQSGPAREKAMTLELARRAALVAFSIGTEQVALPCDEDAMWYADGHRVVKERPCDYQKDGIRVWRIE